MHPSSLPPEGRLFSFDFLGACAAATHAAIQRGGDFLYVYKKLIKKNVFFFISLRAQGP